MSPDFSCETSVIILIHSLLLKTYPTVVSSLVYLLSQKTLHACRRASYLLSQLHGSGNLRSGWRACHREDCGPVSIPSVFSPFTFSWCPGSPLLPSGQPLPV